MQNSSVPPNSPSVQKMFNGNYNMQWLIDKAEYELRLSFEDFIHHTENIANLSVTLAHLCDWALAFKPSIFAECMGMQDIRDIARIECPKALFFVDISNEYKHADRSRSSELVKGVYEYFQIVDKNIINGIEDKISNKGVIINKTGNEDRFVLIKPVIIDTENVEYLFWDCAIEVICWWRSIDDTAN